MSGGTLYLALERVPADLAARVRGGVPGSGGDGMWADRILEVDAAGRQVWEWSAYRHLDVETDVLPTTSTGPNGATPTPSFPWTATE